MARGIIAKLRQLLSRKKKKITRHEKILVEWQQLYKDLQTHPLTQAKIINEQLLETTNEELKKVNKRLDDIEKRVEQLEKRRIKIIKRAATSKQKKETETKEKEQPKTPQQKIIRLSLKDIRLSDQEREILKHIEKQGETDAQTIAEQFNISRSNASLKLNKLYSWGFLDKQMKDKTVFYFLRGKLEDN